MQLFEENVSIAWDTNALLRWLLVNCYVVAKVFRVFMQLLGDSLLTQVPPIVSMIFISYNMSLYEILYVLLFILLFELFVLLLAR